MFQISIASAPLRMLQNRLLWYEFQDCNFGRADQTASRKHPLPLTQLVGEYNKQKCSLAHEQAQDRMSPKRIQPGEAPLSILYLDAHVYEAPITLK